MIRGCIFDLGGTIVDKYSLTPFRSFKNAFQKHNINIRNSLIRNDMGMEKKAHIQKILQDPYTARNWFIQNKEYPGKEAVEKIYHDFNEIQNNQAKHIDVIPETKKCINYLRDKNILLGCTTGFGKETMENIGTVLRKNDIYLDSYVSSTCVDSSYVRPKAGMIYRNMMNLDLFGQAGNIIKVDDTQIGIKEGKTAGCITVGVARWSTYMGFEPDIDEILNDTDMQRKLIQSRRKLSQANPDYIVDTLDHLIPLINRINQTTL